MAIPSRITILTLILSSVLLTGTITSLAAAPPGKYEFTIEADPTPLHQTLDSFGTLTSDNLEWSTSVKDPSNNDLEFVFKAKSVEFSEIAPNQYSLSLNEMKGFSFKYKQQDGTLDVDILIVAKTADIDFIFSTDAITGLPMLDINGIFKDGVVFNVYVALGIPIPFPVYSYNGPLLELSIHIKKPEQEPGKWEIKLPGNYESFKNQFITLFPNFESGELHYTNPFLGPPGGPYATLTLDVSYLKAMADSENFHLDVQDLNLKIEGMTIPGSPSPSTIEIAAKEAVLDINTHSPDPVTGEFGEITSTFKNNVAFHIPNIPGLLDGYDYEGPELNVKITLFEPPPRNDVSVECWTNRWYVTDDDIFNSQQVTGSKNWSLRYHNQNDATHDIVQDLTLTVESTNSFDWVSPEGLVEAPSSYTWSFGDIDECWSGERSMEIKSSPEPFTPPFAITRSINPVKLVESGMQTFTLSITPTAEMEAFNFGIGLHGHPNAEAYIKDVNIVADELNWDQKNLGAMIKNPEVGKTYTFMITLFVDLKPKAPWIESMPEVQVSSAQTISQSSVEGNSMTTDVIGLGIVTWSATQRNDEYRWNWKESNSETVCMTGYMRTNKVYVEFDTIYKHSTQENTVSNTWLDGERNTHTEIYNFEDGTKSPVSNTELTFTTGLTINFISTLNGAIIEPLDLTLPWTPTPQNPVVKWGFDNIEEGQQAAVDVAICKQDTPFDMNFYPGFDAKIDFDTTFETGTAEDRTLKITATPQEPMEIFGMSVDTHTHDTELIKAQILQINANTPPGEGDGFSITEDGTGAWIWVHNPIIGHEYVYDVVINVEVISTGPTEPISYRPDVEVSANTPRGRGTIAGNSVSMNLPNVGIWTWTANGKYSWEWQERTMRTVRFWFLLPT